MHSLARPLPWIALVCCLAGCTSLDEGGGNAEELRRSPGLPGLPGDGFDPCPGGRCPDGGPPPDPDGGRPFFDEGGVEQVDAQPPLVVRTLHRDHGLPRVPLGPVSMQLTKVRAGETVEAVLLPGGAPSPRLHVGLPGGEQLVTSGGTAGAPLWRADRSYEVVRLRVSAAPGTGAGEVRLVRNDRAVPGHDADGDRLGVELEAHLGLCSRRLEVADGFDCRRATDLRDTDGDGIRDDWEVVGRRDLTPHQPLALWGADPRHKDVFLEVDFMERCPDTDPSDPDERRMRANVAVDMAEAFSDAHLGSTPAEEALRAAELGNPDGRPGISLHLDIGRAPTQPDHATIYGDWGGFDEVEPVEADNACGFAGAKVQDVWQDEMSLARRGIFHYALGYGGGGGSVIENRVYSAWNMGSWLNAAHEFGHSFGIGHSGPSHARPGDANCKPNYPSIMNYAYYDHWNDVQNVGFSGGFRGGSYDNRNVAERFAVDPSDTRYLDHLESVFHYNVDRVSGHVDWNRDGYFSSSNVRAYVNFAPFGSGCEWTRYNRVELEPEHRTAVSPALARLGRRTYVFYADASDGLLRYTYTTSYLDCPEVQDGCDGASFVAPRTVMIGGETVDATQGVAATRVRNAGRDELVVVAVGEGAGWIREIRVAHEDRSEQWSGPVSLGTLAGGEPSLATIDGNVLYLAYRGRLDRRVYTMRWSAPTGWTGPARAVRADGTDLPRMATTASPAIVQTYLPDGLHAAAPNVYGFFANGAADLVVYRLVPSTGRWEVANVLDFDAQIMGKPAVEWVPFGGSAYPGRAYLLYQDSAGNPRMAITHADGIGPSATRKLGLDSPLDNVWMRARGGDLLFEPGFDTALRGVTVSASGNPASANRITLRPNADGTTVQAHEDVSDLRVMSITLCRTLMRPTDAVGGPVDSAIASPIACPDWDYPWF